MIILTYAPNPDMRDYDIVRNVSIEIDEQEGTLYDVLEQFANFLRVAGYTYVSSLTYDTLSPTEIVSDCGVREFDQAEDKEYE